jgi:hypothetical protein
MPHHRQSLLVLMFGLLLLGCASKSQPTRPGEAAALKAAQKWMETQGIDANAVELRAEPSGSDWIVLIEVRPATPGGHTTLRIDSKGKVLEVIPGA